MSLASKLAPMLSRLQTVIDLAVLHAGRAQPCWVIRFPVSADLTTGALCLTKSDVVTVTGIVPSGQQEVTSTVVTVARNVASHQATAEIGVKEVDEVAELRLFRKDCFPRFCWMCHGDKADLCGKALTKFLFRENSSPAVVMSVK